MRKIPAKYITLRWRGKYATPLTIRLDVIESISPTKDQHGTNLSYGNGQTASVTINYDTLLDIIKTHSPAGFIDLPPDGGYEQPLPKHVTEGPNRRICEDSAESIAELNIEHPNA